MATHAVEYHHEVLPGALAPATHSPLFSRIGKFFRREAARRGTVTELSRLTNNQLRDIGLSRDMISEVAYELTHGAG